MTGQAQRRNSQMVDNLRADYQPRYEPNFAWKGQAGLYLGLPALRAYWPLGAQINTVQSAYASDVANNFHLSNSGAMHGYDDLIQYVEFDGQNDYLMYADNAQFDITGTEGNVVAAQRGLTLGAWVCLDAVNDEGVIGKWDGASNNVSYLLYFNTQLKFLVSNNGTAYTGVGSSASVTAGTTWHLAIGRFVPSTSLDVYLDGVKTSNVAAIYASLFSGAAELNVGAAHNHTTTWFTGKISNAFICAAALSDSIIEAIWQQTRAMYRR